jgi:hypothetical protein
MQKDKQPKRLVLSELHGVTTLKISLFRETFVCVDIMWAPLWSSGQSSWLQIQGFVFDFRRYEYQEH